MPPHDLAARSRSLLALTGAVVIWGSTYVVIKGALDDIGPLALALARFLVVLPVLLPLARRAGLGWAVLRLPRFWAFGATGVTVYFGLQNVGIALTTAGSAALITAAIPGATALLAFAVLGERPSRLRWIGIGVSTAGVALLVGSGLELGRWEAVAGNLLVLGSAVAWALYTIQGRRLGASYPPVVSTTASFITGSVLLVPLAAAELAVLGPPTLTGAVVAATLYLGLLGSGLAILLWNVGLREVEASAAGAFTNVVPVVGLAFAVGLGEPVAATQLVGGALAGLGVLLTQRGSGSARRLGAQPPADVGTPALAVEDPTTDR
jgi:drug/metabolite transporter (DMT)-like permease